MAYDYKRGEKRAPLRRSQTPAERQAAGSGGNARANELASKYLAEARQFYASGKAKEFMQSLEQQTGHKLPAGFIKTQLSGWDNLSGKTATQGANLLQNKIGAGSP